MIIMINFRFQEARFIRESINLELKTYLSIYIALEINKKNYNTPQRFIEYFPEL